MSDHLPASPLPVDAMRKAPNSATYLYADGTSITLHGDRPYRNNNPGNLRYMGRSGPDRARADGALGMEQGGFAMFPSVSAGEAALRAAIDRGAAGSRSLASFLNQYAPPGDGNNTAGYIATVAKALGVDASATLDVLGVGQRGLLAQTIMVQEGGAGHGHEFGAPTVERATGGEVRMKVERLRGEVGNGGVQRAPHPTLAGYACWLSIKKRQLAAYLPRTQRPAAFAAVSIQLLRFSRPSSVEKL